MIACFIMYDHNRRVANVNKREKGRVELLYADCGM